MLLLVQTKVHVSATPLDHAGPSISGTHQSVGVTQQNRLDRDSGEKRA